MTANTQRNTAQLNSTQAKVQVAYAVGSKQHTHQSAVASSLDAQQPRHTQTTPAHMLCMQTFTLLLRCSCQQLSTVPAWHAPAAFGYRCKRQVYQQQPMHTTYTTPGNCTAVLPKLAGKQGHPRLLTLCHARSTPCVVTPSSLITALETPLATLSSAAPADRKVPSASLLRCTHRVYEQPRLCPAGLFLLTRQKPSTAP